VERYSSRGEDEARDPIFRSDLEERPEPPRYEPLRPGGGLWSVVKRLLQKLLRYDDYIRIAGVPPGKISAVGFEPGK